MNLNSLKTIVQANCDIVDAQHAFDLPLCIYLLKMRDYYRWSRNSPLSEHLNKSTIGNWITNQETYWQTLEDIEISPIQIFQKEFDCFDLESINSIVSEYGLFYGAGLGVVGIPSFFLADLISHEQIGKHRLFITGREHARGLLATPAMVQSNTIIIRRDSLLRLLHEKIEEWQWHKNDSAMSRAMVFYNFNDNYEQSLQNMTNDAIESVTLHELGELMAGEYLGDAWIKMLTELDDRQLEKILRAIKDHMADCLQTLPAIIEKENVFAIHLYMAGFEGYRKQLWPALQNAYKNFLNNNNLSEMQKCVENGVNHWLQIAENIIDNYQQDKQLILNFKKLDAFSLS